MSDVIIGYNAQGQAVYDNAPTVVAVAVIHDRSKLLVIRRNTNPGKGLLALPGGFQMRGESWQAAGAREVFEEVGLIISDPQDQVKFLSMGTDEFGHNVVIAVHWTNKSMLQANAEEVSEMLWVDIDELYDTEDEQWAFQMHHDGAIDALEVSLYDH